MSSAKKVECNKSGYICRWTNYVKGYKKRWFVLQDGYLSYYRNESEINHACRGTINVATATIHVVDNQHFVISNRGSQAFHLRSLSESDQKDWLEALRLAKTKAILYMDKVDMEMATGGPNSVEEVEHCLNELTTRLQEIKKHQETMEKKCDEFVREAESFSGQTTAILAERAKILRSSSKQVIKACLDYHQSGTSMLKRFRQLMTNDEDRVGRLEQMIEDLARQHSRLEQRIQTQGSHTDGEDTSFMEESSSDESFYDADDTLNGDALADTQLVVSNLEEANKSPRQKKREKQMAHLGHDLAVSNLAPVAVQRERSPARLAVIPVRAKVKRRTEIPPKPNVNMNLWGILKNCIGKDLSKIPMPVNFSEPLSLLQRLTENFEYSNCLDEAAKCTDSLRAMAYIAAFTVSSYASTAVRVNKPFNPLLGETYECDRTDDLGWRSLSEQISHHPPVSAIFCESEAWYSWQDFAMSTKFRGKYLQLDPMGSTHLMLRNNRHHYMWRKVRCIVHNIVVGRLWIDNVGEMEIVNFTTKEHCKLYFKPYSYFSKDTPRHVSGKIFDRDGRVRMVLSGAWDQFMEVAVVNDSSLDAAMDAEDRQLMDLCGPATRLWTASPLPPNAERMYYFSSFAITLNEPDSAVAPTDSRRRPDQILMEQGKWDEANEEKLRLEHNQRQKRATKLESGDNGTGHSMNENSTGKTPGDNYEALWFQRVIDPDSNEETVKFNGRYWDCKSQNDWSRCPNIF